MKKELSQHVLVCLGGKSCPRDGSKDVYAKIKDEVKRHGLKKEVMVTRTDCLDQCGKGPIVVVYPDGVWYCDVGKKDAEEIVERHIIKGKPVKRLRYNPK